jgi:acyl-CoA thioester hydrolase
MSHRFFERTVGIYFDDLDPMQVLHNARYLLLFERTLGAFWMDRGLGAFGDSERPDQFHMVCHNEVTYLLPVKGVGRVRVRLWAERIGRTSLTFAFRLLANDRDEVHARGARTIVHVDSTTLRPTPWSDAFREALAPYTADSGPDDR